MTYTLMDTDTGNLIGTYATEQEALILIQGAIVAYGPEYAESLVLGREDAEGHTMLIAEGEGLAKRALGLTVSS